MIYHLKGEIAEKGDGFVVVDVSGVGYKVFVSPETESRLKEKDTLYCFTQFTGTALRLYGFKEKENLSFFEDLLKISGVGPKSALHLASIAPMEELKKAIEAEDEKVINRIMKIGKKKGERIIFELSQKKMTPQKDEVFEVLKGLGFDSKDIASALDNVSSEKTKEERVKLALRILGK